MLEVLGGDDAFEGGHGGFVAFGNLGGGVEDGLKQLVFGETVGDSIEWGASELLAVEGMATGANLGEEGLAEIGVTGLEFGFCLRCGELGKV